MRAVSSRGEQGLFFAVDVWASRSSGFSCEAWALASVVAVPGL